MNNIKAVIFDMDGVIFDTESLWKKFFIAANEKFNISLSEQYRQSICGKSESLIRQELRELIPHFDADVYRDFISDKVKNAILKGDFETKKDFDKIIPLLKEKGYKLGLATSSDKSRAKNMFTKKGYDIKAIFDAEVYGDEVGTKSKPDPYMFKLVAEKLGVSPQECIVIEDSINGIIAAKTGGFVPVMVVDLINPDEYCKKNCKLILDDLGELRQYL